MQLVPGPGRRYFWKEMIFPHLKNPVMRQNTLSPKLLVAVYCIICMFGSCVVGGGIADPYIVDELRQKENFYYVPSSHNAPLLKEKNDLSGSLQRSSSNKHSGVELQTAYIASKHIGIITSYSSGSNKKDDDLNYHRLEMGAGYIISINKLWHFETYAGYGGGKITNHHYSGQSTVKNNYFFLQPAIAVSNENQTVQFAFVSKLIGNHFNVTDTSFAKDREPFSASQVQILEDNPFHIFWEPGIVFRFGWKHFLFHTGYSISADLTRSDLHRAKDNFSIGMYLKFNTRK
jgi:hypothetical protein